MLLIFYHVICSMCFKYLLLYLQSIVIFAVVLGPVVLGPVCLVSSVISSDEYDDLNNLPR